MVPDPLAPPGAALAWVTEEATIAPLPEFQVVGQPLLKWIRVDWRPAVELPVFRGGPSR